MGHRILIVDTDQQATSALRHYFAKHDLDVIGAAEEADDVSWWENTAGDGSAWTEYPIDADLSSRMWQRRLVSSSYCFTYN